MNIFSPNNFVSLMIFTKLECVNIMLIVVAIAIVWCSPDQYSGSLCKGREISIVLGVWDLVALFGGRCLPK